MKVAHSKLQFAVFKVNTLRKNKQNKSRGMKNELVLSREKPDKRILLLLSEYLQHMAFKATQLGRKGVEATWH